MHDAIGRNESYPRDEDTAPRSGRTKRLAIGAGLAAVAILSTAALVNLLVDYKLGSAGSERAPRGTAPIAPTPPPAMRATQDRTPQDRTPQDRTPQDMAAAQKTLSDALLKMNAQPSAPSSPVLARPDPVDAPATAAPSTAAVPTSPPLRPAATAPALKPDEVSRMLLRASSLIREGQVASARSLLELAARSNDASVAFALAETYDPKTLSRWRAIGIAGDADRARTLYKQALDGGVAEAGTRLTQLDR